MHIAKVAEFPFPTAPDLLQLQAAEKRLHILGALQDNKATELGKYITRFPVLPRYGKMMALSHQHNLQAYTISIVAALSVQEVLLETPISFVSPDKLKALRQRWFATRKQWAGLGNSLLLGDIMVLLRAVGAAEYANSEGKLERFCEENGLRHKAIIEIRKLRKQLTDCLNNCVPDCSVIVDPKMEPPSDLQAKLLRQILLSGMGDQIAKKITPDEIKDTDNKVKYKYAYKANNMEEPVFLHQGSVLKGTLPEFVIYQEIYETNKMYMRGVTAIEPEWLPFFVPHLCQLSEPLLVPEPRYEPDDGKIYCTVTGSFGPQNWQLPQVEIVHPKTLDYYKWFAKFLLDGAIFPKLGKFKAILLSPPTTMVKSWAKLQPRTVGILKALSGKDVYSKDVLLDLWKSDSKCK